MSNVGELLQHARKEKEWTLQRVSEKTKIRIKHLQALEDEAWDKLPGLPYIKGFLKNYSRVLGLDPEHVLAVFRRQYKHEVKMEVLPDAYEETRKTQKSFFLTIRELLSKIVP